MEVGGNDGEDMDGVKVQKEHGATLVDSRSGLIVMDGPDDEPNSFFAKKSISLRVSRVRRNQVTSVVLRKHRNVNNAKVVRFLC